MIFTSLNLDIIKIIIGLISIFLCYFEYEKIITKRENLRFEIKEEEEKEEIDEYKKMDIKVPIGYEREYNVFNDLKEIYDCKEETTKKLIDKKFNPNEMSYERFMSHIDKCHELFYKEFKNGVNLIAYSSYGQKYIETMFNEYFENLEKIIDKIDDLMNEMIKNEEKVTKIDIENLSYDMDILINSIKDY